MVGIPPRPEALPRPHKDAPLVPTTVLEPPDPRPPGESGASIDGNSAKRVSPTNANDDYDVSHPLPKKRSYNNSSNSAKNRGATMAMPPNNGEGNGSKSAKRVTPNNTNNGYDVGNPSAQLQLPRRRGPLAS